MRSPPAAATPRRARSASPPSPCTYNQSNWVTVDALGGPRLVLIVVVIYLVLNFVVTSLVQPHFIGDAVGLSVTITFLALVFWGWLLGPVGAVLAVPLTLLVKALLVDADPAAEWAHALLGSPAVLRRMSGPGDAQPVDPQPEARDA